MILDEVTLYNFGPYSDRQTITLTPAASDQPIVLFGGLNGGGKTTFMDALQLCLFGSRARVSNRGTLAYGEYLSRSIHNGTESPEASIEISFRHTRGGHEQTYKLKRFWYRAKGGCKEFVKVWKNGVEDAALAQNWPTQVEEFIPPNIAHLFLFDGEQIEGYASYEHSAKLIGAAIQNLLGLDMVDRLEKDLIVYERRKRSEKMDDKALVQINLAEDELRNLRERADELIQERASLQTHGIDRKQRLVSSVEAEYRKLGGDLFDRRLELESHLSDTEKTFKEGEEMQRETATGKLPLLMVRELLESAKSRDRHEEECRRAREVLNVLQNRDQATLVHLRWQAVSDNVLRTIKKFFREDREKRRALAKNQTFLNLSPAARSVLHRLLQMDLEDTADVAWGQIEQHKIQKASVAHARSEVLSIPSADTISKVGARRDELKKELDGLKVQFARLSDDIERIYRDIERKEQALTRLIETNVEAMNDHDDRTRVLRYSAKVRGTLRKFRKAAIERHVHRIEQLVLESLQQLLRKTSLVARLSIDPEQFSITLYGGSGQILTAERLSAGERQLLGIALLWGLAKASGRPLPTAIDTPLGRLDASHRMHLVERYLPFASHQVLLFSTDEEIAGDYLDRLRPWICRSYYLNYDDNAGKTQIVPGYFGKLEVA